MFAVLNRFPIHHPKVAYFLSRVNYTVVVVYEYIGVQNDSA